MTTEAYAQGCQAFEDWAEPDENPYYTAFGDLAEEYYEWNRGWNDAEDTWYRKLNGEERAL